MRGVAEYSDDDQAAFAELVERYQARIYRSVFALLRNPEEAEDVAQPAALSAQQEEPHIQAVVHK